MDRVPLDSVADEVVVVRSVLVVDAVEMRLEAAAEPPRPAIVLRTVVIETGVVVAVVSAELLSVVVVVPGRRQRVAGVSARHEAGDVQPEVVRLRRQPEVAVLGPVRLVVPRDHLNAQAIIPLVSQLMNAFVAEPEFAFRLTEAASIVGPVSVEVDAAIQTPLNHRPARVVVNVATSLEWHAGGARFDQRILKSIDVLQDPLIVCFLTICWKHGSGGGTRVQESAVCRCLMAEKVGDDGTKLVDGPFIVAELLLLSLHVASQVLDLTRAIVSSHRQKVAVDLLLFAQLLHHLFQVVYSDGLIEPHRLLHQSSAESLLQFVQFSVDVSLRQRHVTNMAVIGS